VNPDACPAGEPEPRRSALVTGGSRGIGLGAVRALVARGLDVVFTYRGAESAAKEVAAECDGLPGRVEARHYDLLDSDPAELIDEVLATHGRLDSVVLNAGIWQGGRLEDLDEGQWWTVVETNLRGCARLSRAAVSALTQSPNGSLVLVSSAVGIVGFAGDTAYASAKAAMIGLARSLAKEVGGRGVRVNVLAPGFITTDMTGAIPDGSRDRILARGVLRRMGTVEEMGKAIAFLSEDATYCTGTVLVADGGWTL
jgi:3-oxoacyl-[acyl-carrier protein] reductase